MDDNSPSSCLTIDIRIETDTVYGFLPEVEALCRAAAQTTWAEENTRKKHGALARRPLLASPENTSTEENVLSSVELTIVVADDGFVQNLNRDYRGKDEPTNVLAFAALDGPEDPLIPGEALMLGDVILAVQTTVHEAAQKAVSPADHLRHLVVHGVLHLLGYDHEEDAAAEAMECLEVRILARLGIADPYAGPCAGPCDTDAATTIHP